MSKRLFHLVLHAERFPVQKANSLQQRLEPSPKWLLEKNFSWQNPFFFISMLSGTKKESCSARFFYLHIWFLNYKYGTPGISG